MTTLERNVEEKIESLHRYIIEAYPSKRINELLDEVLQAERQKQEELCKNHLETLEDALNDPDLYGAINGMAHALREHLTHPNNTK